MIPKYKEYFKDCIGALDGTHIAAHAPANQAPPYRNRKGYLSRNVLAVCDFNLEFTYDTCLLDGKDLLMIVQFLRMLL